MKRESSEAEIRNCVEVNEVQVKVLLDQHSAQRTSEAYFRHGGEFGDGGRPMEIQTNSDAQYCMRY